MSAAASNSVVITTDKMSEPFGRVPWARPRPNRNQNAGLDVSPAVRDYLGLTGTDVCDWKFVSRPQPGPWSSTGVILARR
jgi:hypothetical protein